MIRCSWEWYTERLPPSRKACFCTVVFFLINFCSRFPSDSCELQVAMKRFRRFRPFGTFQLRMDVSGSPSGPNKWLECFESWDILIRWVNPPLAHLARLQRSHFSSVEGWDVGEMGWMILRRPWVFSVDFTFLSGCLWPDLFLGLVREPLDYDALVLLVDSCRRMNMQKMRKKLGGF